MTDELLEKLSAPIPGDPAPRVTQFYFDIDSCVRFLKVSYDQFVRWPGIVQKVYRWYFQLRAHYEQEEEERMEAERKRREEMDRLKFGRQDPRR